MAQLDGVLVGETFLHPEDAQVVLVQFHPGGPGRAPKSDNPHVCPTCVCRTI